MNSYYAILASPWDFMDHLINLHNMRQEYSVSNEQSLDLKGLGSGLVRVCSINVIWLKNLHHRHRSH